MKTEKTIVKSFIVILVTTLLMVSPCSGSNSIIGVSVPTLENPFWRGYVDFAEVVAKQLELELRVVDCRTNETRQLADIEDLIAKGVGGLMVTPQTVQIGPAIITRAQKAGIPIVITDRWPGIDPREYGWEGFVGFIGPDDKHAGYHIADTLIKELGKKNIVAINGVHGASVAEGRYMGLTRALKESKGVNLVDVQWIGETEKEGKQAMAKSLAAYPGKVDGVWCYNDSLAVGAISEIMARGMAGKLKKRKIAVVGMDLNTDAVKLIEDGHYYASFGGHWLQGGFGLIMLYDYLNGHLPNPEFKVVRLKLMNVTEKTVPQFRNQFIENPPAIDAKDLSKALNPAASGKYFFEIRLR